MTSIAISMYMTKIQQGCVLNRFKHETVYLYFGVLHSIRYKVFLKLPKIAINARRQAGPKDTD